jgi:diketogulonate reductase-like aldo/keto reductase
MDWIGFGTMEYPENPDMYDATLLHLRNGFRHLDCAEMYASTSSVGRAIADSGIERSELKITSKLRGMPSGEYEAVRGRTESHLKELGVTFADLLLIHFPSPYDSDMMDPEKLKASATMDFFENNIAGAWQNMQKLKDDGLALQIGVSNFYRTHMDEFEKKVPGALPFANEIYLDATSHEIDFVAHMQEKGIKVIAYRPVAFVNNYAMLKDMGDMTLDTLDAEKEKVGAATIQQLVLAWLIRRGCHVLVKTASEEHLRGNVMATQLANSASWSEQPLADLAEGSEMALACGASDEFAAVFKEMGA